LNAVLLSRGRGEESAAAVTAVIVVTGEDQQNNDEKQEHGAVTFTEQIFQTHTFVASFLSAGFAAPAEFMSAPLISGYTI